jgi:hypothetical protein
MLYGGELRERFTQLVTLERPRPAIAAQTGRTYLFMDFDERLRACIGILLRIPHMLGKCTISLPRRIRSQPLFERD